MLRWSYSNKVVVSLMLNMYNQALATLGLGIGEAITYKNDGFLVS